MPATVTSKRRTTKAAPSRAAKPLPKAVVETKHEVFARLVAELRRDAEALVLSSERNLARLR